MIKPSTLKFLEQLGKNNNKPWFEKHKEDYNEAKEDFEEFVAVLMEKIAPLEPLLKDQKPKDSIFRIFRDVRFSKDKTPYKSHFGAFLSKGGRKYTGAGYYIHLEPGKSFAGGGLWMPESLILKGVRQEIDYNFDEFNKMINEKTFKKLFKNLEGEQLKTLPQGYAADNPAINFLKMKSFTVGHEFLDKDVTGKNFTSKCMDIFTAMRPLIDFLNRAVD